MPIHAVGEKWPKPEDSVGGEIQTRRMALLRSKKVWWACGPTLARFDEDIQPAIDSALRNIDACHYDIDLRLYMMGRKKESSRPIIFVCCSDATVRRDAEDCIRKSGLLRKYPGFGLGASPLPLEGISKVLSGDDLHPELSVPGENNSESEVFAQEELPVVGRKLWVRLHANGPFLRRGTGGVVIVVDGKHYQLTAGHIRDDESLVDWEDLHFDGQFDDDDDEDDRSESSGIDCGSTSRGSRTPLGILGLEDSESPRSTPSGMTTNETRAVDLPETTENESDSLKYVGTIKLYSKDLDYALVNIPEPDSGVDLLNLLQFPRGLGQRPIHIRSIREIPVQDQSVVVITSSQGPITATLQPSFAYVRPAGSMRFQKTHVMELNGEALHGDSGAPVVDSVSGELYGMLVRGCPGTRIAYVLSAHVIFEDIGREVHAPVSILTSPANAALDNASGSFTRLPGPPTVADTHITSWGFIV
ncbi:hypothetical protein B0T16DRAFT_384484 [Cercophora newfieldiana]|uniref:Uncharacterized protein n=1 Tax=Cercophora newfieldiana TaxID=92897 RepID=A0AA40CY23_9PEZI|nr:hypothetical protein B0T16DRAFT_384484 [Cercophora newfieldiana]